MVIDLRRVGLVVLIIALVAVFASTGIKIIGMQSSLNREEQPVVQVSQPVVNSPVVPESTGTGDSYFTEYRMERERMRGKQVEMLRGILDQSSNDKEARQAASLRLVEISADMEREMKAENKGSGIRGLCDHYPAGKHHGGNCCRTPATGSGARTHLSGE
jgi:stage III sporulation protein AH